MFRDLVDAFSQAGLIVPNLPRLFAWVLLGTAIYNALFVMVGIRQQIRQSGSERKLYRWGLVWAIVAAVAAWFLVPKSFMIILDGGAL